MFSFCLLALSFSFPFLCFPSLPPPRKNVATTTNDDDRDNNNKNNKNTVALLDSTVKVFHDDSLKFFLSLYGHKLPVMSMDISDDGALLATGSADKTVKIWGLDFGDCHRSLLAHDDSIMVILSYLSTLLCSLFIHSFLLLFLAFFVSFLGSFCGTPWFQGVARFYVVHMYVTQYLTRRWRLSGRLCPSTACMKPSSVVIVVSSWHE